MFVSGVAFAAYVGFTSLVAVALALAAVTHFGASRQRTRITEDGRGSGDGVVFLFDQSGLVDATRAGERLLNAAPAEGSDWGRLLSLLAPEFEGLAARLEDLAAEKLQVFTSRDASTRLTAEFQNGLRRLSLFDEDVSPPAADIDIHSLNSMEREIDILRANTDLAPNLVWRQNEVGEVTWLNRRYLEEVRKLHGAGAADQWPVAPLFESGTVAEAAATKRTLRAALPGPNGEQWFEIHVAQLDRELLCWATDIGSQVRAKGQLRSFMQTFTKTFADLDVGLAIFDKSRKLTMFNPALAELTGLSPTFLAAHPTLFGVLDRMRDNGRVPEPRNYSEWRRRMAELESDAREGTFCETWPLPAGDTLRVTGRPHPDGAIAFVIEDITAEISLARRFRCELEIGQSILESIDHAVAVFSPSGTLAMSNAAYGRLWGRDPATSLEGATVADVLKDWELRSAPTRLWAQAAAFIANPASRAPWSQEAILRDGRALICRFAPLAAGSTMVTFEVTAGLAGEVQFRRGA